MFLEYEVGSIMANEGFMHTRKSFIALTVGSIYVTLDKCLFLELSLSLLSHVLKPYFTFIGVLAVFLHHL